VYVQEIVDCFAFNFKYGLFVENSPTLSMQKNYIARLEAKLNDERYPKTNERIIEKGKGAHWFPEKLFLFFNFPLPTEKLNVYSSLNEIVFGEGNFNNEHVPEVEEAFIRFMSTCD